MLFDDLFEYFGDLGPYQICVFLVNVMPMIIVGTNSVPFIIANMDHWCKVPSLLDLPPDQQKYIAIPMDADGQYDQCSVYGLNFSTYR